MVLSLPLVPGFHAWAEQVLGLAILALQQNVMLGSHLRGCVKEVPLKARCRSHCVDRILLSASAEAKATATSSTNLNIDLARLLLNLNVEAWPRTLLHLSWYDVWVLVHLLLDNRLLKGHALRLAFSANCSHLNAMFNKYLY